MSRWTPQRAHTYSRSARSRCRARATSYAVTKASESRISVTSGRVPATGRERSRLRCDLREPRARPRADLSRDRRRQLLAGRDGDVHDVRGVVADEQRTLLLAG